LKTDGIESVGDSESLHYQASSRTGGRILVDALRVHGVDRIFCVPGESYLDVLDALYDVPQIHLVVAKHEGAAANMAEADGKLTGRPGICFVTRGPGATHASVGVHTAYQDSTPMILFVGQVATSARGREAFQEIEHRQLFAPITKWVAEIEAAEQIPNFLLRAFNCATSGRPGPVVLSLPEDVLAQTASVENTTRFVAEQPEPQPADIERLRTILNRSERPLLIVGGAGWTAEGCRAIEAFAKENCLPVAASFRRQDLFDNRNPCYVGHLGLGPSPKLIALLQDSDLLLAVGTRLGDIATGGYSVLKPPRLKQTLVHIHADPSELGRVFQPDQMINASPSRFASALTALKPIETPVWSSRTERAHNDFLEFSQPPNAAPSRGVDLARIVDYLSTQLPKDAIVTNGAGNYTAWVHRFFKYKQLRTELAPTSGAMGYGFPAAIAAKLRHPERLCVCFAGDGCFLMYPQELATAMQFRAAIIILVVNNGIYGTIRMHQEKRFPGRISGTDILDPDFVALAKAFGVHAERVESTDDFASAFERAVASGKTALLELPTDWHQISPDRRLP
jgi:acetolactate synthase-1/2/3 large subunit